VADIYKEKCHLLWEPPVDDGGIGIDYYLVEMQDSGVGRKWTEVGRIQGDTQCGIPNLEAGRKYKFRVRACNQEGESEPLATEKEIHARIKKNETCFKTSTKSIVSSVQLQTTRYFSFIILKKMNTNT